MIDQHQVHFGPRRHIYLSSGAEYWVRADTPPDPRETEWWSDYTLTEIESDEASVDDEPGVFIIVVDEDGNEHSIAL